MLPPFLPEFCPRPIGDVQAVRQGGGIAGRGSTAAMKVRPV
jgi:hypothetical protein